MLVSSPNPNASFYSSSSCRVPYKDIHQTLLKGEEKIVCNAVRGLICLGSKFEMEIFNPGTKQQYIFPQISIGDFLRTNYFFGYDPVEDQYKVLEVSVMHLSWSQSVVVLGGDEVRRKVPSFGYRHSVQTSGLCINGTVYYGATRSDNNNVILVSFDVRHETFNIIKFPVVKEYRRGFMDKPLINLMRKIGAVEKPRCGSFKRKIGVVEKPRCGSYRSSKRDFTDKTLINFWGKVGVVEKPHCGSFRMWVLKDAEKEEWFMNTYQLPGSAACLDLDVMNYFYAGEICLVPRELSNPFCLFFYHLKLDRIRNVTIEGLPISELQQGRDLSVTVSEHYESFNMFLKTSS